jgi:hypothetical protein
MRAGGGVAENRKKSMTFKICKVIDGRPMWLRKFSPAITWVARAQARGFKTKDEATRVATRLTATGQAVTVVKDAFSN